MIQVFGRLRWITLETIPVWRLLCNVNLIETALRRTAKSGKVVIRCQKNTGAPILEKTL